MWGRSVALPPQRMSTSILSAQSVISLAFTTGTFSVAILRLSGLRLVKTAVASEHRILVFSQFTSMLDIIKTRLKEEKISYFYLDGSTPSEKRIELSDRFNNGEKEVFLISLKAGGFGLNLTGADMVIHFDPWWNPAVMEQASDRAYRIGQQKNVQVIRLASKDTIEEKILTLAESKRKLAADVVDGELSGLKTMSAEEILSLFD